MTTVDSASLRGAEAAPAVVDATTLKGGGWTATVDPARPDAVDPASPALTQAAEAKTGEISAKTPVRGFAEGWNVEFSGFAA